MKKSFGRIDKKVMEYSEIDVKVKALYALIFGHADSGSNQCSPSNTMLAAGLNLSTRTIMRYNEVLVFHKIITRQRTKPGHPLLTQINHGEYL